MAAPMAEPAPHPDASGDRGGGERGTGRGALLPARRLLTELALLMLWPFELAAFVLVPLAPVAAIIVAELERARGRACGASTAPQRPPARGWPTWIAHRIRSSALWRHDAPLMLVSTAAGAVSAVAVACGAAALLALVISPGLIAAGETVVLGSVRLADAPGLALVVLICAGVMGTSAAVLLAISLLRDACCRTFSRDRSAELTARLDEVSTNRAEIVQGFESERRRIEQDLHDGVQQDLLALSMTVGLLEYRLGQDDASHRELVRRARDQVERSLRSLREIVHGIHPRELSDLGLGAAIQALCERSPVEVDVEIDPRTDEVDVAAASALYFTAAEALSNVERHSGATSAVLRLARRADSVRLEVIDDGEGGATITGGRSTGLSGLQQRMRAVGGDLVLDSTPGRGTRVRAETPAERGAAAGTPQTERRSA